MVSPGKTAADHDFEVAKWSFTQGVPPLRDCPRNSTFLQKVKWWDRPPRTSHLSKEFLAQMRGLAAGMLFETFCISEVQKVKSEN